MIETVAIVAKAVGISASLLLGVCSTESDFRNIVKVNDGGSPSYGICQVKLTTAQMFDKNVTAEELVIPHRNAYFAAKYIKWQLKRYEADLEKAISAYNAGRAINGNKKYVEKVLSRREKYKEYDQSENKNIELLPEEMYGICREVVRNTCEPISATGSDEP